MTHISDIIEEEVVAMQDWLDYLVKAGYINAKFDVRSFAQRISEAARKDIPIEHCGEKDCPECNLAAFEAGKKEGVGEAVKILEEQRDLWKFTYNEVKENNLDFAIKREDAWSRYTFALDLIYRVKRITLDNN